MTNYQYLEQLGASESKPNERNKLCIVNENSIITYGTADQAEGKKYIAELGAEYKFKEVKGEYAVWVKVDSNFNYTSYSKKSKKQRQQEENQLKKEVEIRRKKKEEEEKALWCHLPSEEIHRLFSKIITKRQEQIDRGLTEKAREELIRRGFSEEDIEYWGIISVDKEFLRKVSENGGFEGFPLTFADKNHKKYGQIEYCYDYPRILLPVRNNRKQIIGAQLMRIYKEDTFGGKYTWFSRSMSKSGTRYHSAHLACYDGELPLAYYEPKSFDRTNGSDFNNFTLLTEGFLKPMLTASRYTVRTIGSGGTKWNGSPKQLEEILRTNKNYSAQPKEFCLSYAPDGGVLGNTNLHVAVRETLDLVKKFEHEVRVLWWGQFSKQGGGYEQFDKNAADIDELGARNPLKLAIANAKSEESEFLDKKVDYQKKYCSLPGYLHFYPKRGNFKLLHPKQFYSLLTRGAELSKLLTTEELNKKTAQKYGYNYKALNTPEIKTAKLWESYKAGIYYLKSTMGSGKTVSLIDLCTIQGEVVSQVRQAILDEMRRSEQLAGNHYNPKEVLKALRKGGDFSEWAALLWENAGMPEDLYCVKLNIFLLSHRNSLSRASCKVLGIPYREEVTQGYEEPSKLINNSAGLCLDSILKIPVSAAVGASFLLDEIVSLIEHAVIGNTCEKRRAEILEHFKTLLTTAICTGGRVIALDANLNWTTIKQLERALSGCDEGKRFLITNNYDFEKRKWKVEIIPGSISKKKGINFYNHLALLNRFEESVMNGDSNLLVTDSLNSAEKIHEKLQSQGKNGMVVSSETLDDNAIKMMESPDTWLENNKQDYLIFTPTIDAGLSITKKGLFDNVFGLFFGVTQADSANQMLGRYRQNVPRIVWVSPKGQGSKKFENLDINTIKRICTKEGVLNHHKYLVFKSKNAIDWTAEIEKIKDKDLGFLAKNAIEEFLTTNIDKLDCWTQTWGELIAADNLEKSIYAKSLISKLKNDGHELIFEDSIDVSLEYATEVKEAQKKVQESKADRTASAEEPKTLEDLEKLADSNDANKQENLFKIKKGFLKKALNGYDEENFQLTAETALLLEVKDKGRTLKKIQNIVSLFNPEYTKARSLIQFTGKAASYIRNFREPFYGDLKTTAAREEALRTLRIDEMLNEINTYYNLPERGEEESFVLPLEEMKKYYHFGGGESRSPEYELAHLEALRVLGLAQYNPKISDKALIEFYKEIFTTLGLTTNKTEQSGLKFNFLETFENEIWFDAYQRIQRRAKTVWKQDVEEISKIIGKINNLHN